MPAGGVASGPGGGGAPPLPRRDGGPAHPQARDIFPGVAGAAGLLLVLFVANVVAAVGMIVASGGMGDSPPAPPFVVAGYVAAFGITLWFGVLMSRSSFTEVLRPTRFPGTILVPVLAVLFGIWVLLIESMAAFTRLIPIDQSVMEQMNKLIFESLWVGVFLLVIAAPVLEEGLFRGIILRGFLDRYTPRSAIALSALFFSLAHFNIWQLPASFALGLFLGWLYYRTRSLLLCVLVHAFHNLTLAFVAEYVASLLGFPDEMTVVPFVPLWIVAVGALFLVWGIRGIDARLRERESWAEIRPQAPPTR